MASTGKTGENTAKASGAGHFMSFFKVVEHKRESEQLDERLRTGVVWKPVEATARVYPIIHGTEKELLYYLCRMIYITRRIMTTEPYVPAAASPPGTPPPVLRFTDVFHEPLSGDAHDCITLITEADNLLPLHNKLCDIAVSYVKIKRQKLNVCLTERATKLVVWKILRALYRMQSTRDLENLGMGSINTYTILTDLKHEHVRMVGEAIPSPPGQDAWTHTVILDIVPSAEFHIFLHDFGVLYARRLAETMMNNPNVTHKMSIEENYPRW